MKPFSDDQIAHIAARSRALGDGTRVRMLAALSKGEQSVGQLADATSTQQSTASKHLQVLFHAGLVRRRRAASTVLYSIAATDVLEWCRYLGARDLAGGRPRRLSMQQEPATVAAERKRR